MVSKLSAETLISLSVEERKSLILHHASLIDVTHITDEDLHGYFQYQLAQDLQNGTIPLLSLSEILTNFCRYNPITPREHEPKNQGLNPIFSRVTKEGYVTKNRSCFCETCRSIGGYISIENVLLR